MSGFWEWLELKNKEGIIFSIEQCKTELTDGKDKLADWAKRLEATFFRTTDNDVVSSMKHVAEWVEKTSFERHVKARFMDKADPFLIAHGLAHGHSIITHEVFDPNKLRIPTVCKSLGVVCASIYDLLRESGAQFVLQK